MTWQQVMVLQIIASSSMTLWYRKVSLVYSKHTFTLFLTIYLTVAVAGSIISVVRFGGTLPALPTGTVVWYLIGEGLFIPMSWYFSYRLLSIIGASSMAVAQSFIFLTTATLGILLLDEPLTVGLFVGAMLLLSGVYLALSVNGRHVKKNNVTLAKKLYLLCMSALLLSIGLLFEKLAINSIGVWDYAMFGWAAQGAGAVILFSIFGRQELGLQRTARFWRYAFVAGLLTTLTGSLFIYALSTSMLSSVVLASTAKITLTSVLAFWLLKERTYLGKRIAAVALAVCGLLAIFA